MNSTFDSALVCGGGGKEEKEDLGEQICDDFPPNLLTVLCAILVEIGGIIPVHFNSHSMPSLLQSVLVLFDFRPSAVRHDTIHGCWRGELFFSFSHTHSEEFSGN